METNSTKQLNCLCYCVSPKSALKAKTKYMPLPCVCKNHSNCTNWRKYKFIGNISERKTHICTYYTRKWEKEPENWKTKYKSRSDKKIENISMNNICFHFDFGPHKFPIENECNAHKNVQLPPYVTLSCGWLRMWHATNIDTSIWKDETFAQCWSSLCKLLWHFSLFISSICLHLNLKFDIVKPKNCSINQNGNIRIYIECSNAFTKK